MITARDVGATVRSSLESWGWNFAKRSAVQATDEPIAVARLAPDAARHSGQMNCMSGAGVCGALEGGCDLSGSMVAVSNHFDWVLDHVVQNLNLGDRCPTGNC